MKRILGILIFQVSLGSGLFAQGMKMHVINVGQGSSTLIEFPCGVALIDTGGESNGEFNSTDNLMDYLENFFIRRSDLHKTIDLLIITHPHIDHTRGIREVLSKYTIKNVVTNGATEGGSGISQQNFLQKYVTDKESDNDNSDDVGFFAGTIDRIPHNGITNNIIDPFKCSDVDPEIRILWGRSLSDPGWGTTIFGNPNNHSVVCKITYGKATILVTGDLEAEAIATMLKSQNHAIFDSDIYVAGHHCSKNGTTQDLLNVITPKMAILSFGDNTRETVWTAWAYGHPNKGIVDMISTVVSEKRPTKSVWVGNGAHNFTNQPLSKALFGVGWDGPILLSAKADGTWSVLSPSIGSPASDSKVNLNTASLDDLMSLPYIGNSRAKAIIKYREAHPFKTVDEIGEVSGIGPATVALLKDRVKV